MQDLNQGLTSHVSPVQGFVSEQLLPEQSSLIPASLLPGSQVSQQAVTCHPSQVPQQTGASADRCLNSQVLIT